LDIGYLSGDTAHSISPLQVCKGRRPPLARTFLYSRDIVHDMLWGAAVCGAGCDGFSGGRRWVTKAAAEEGVERQNSGRLPSLFYLFLKPAVGRLELRPTLGFRGA
jgi:hypothetical protein